MRSKTQPAKAPTLLDWGKDPHRVLGLHSTDLGSKVVRLWRPGAPFAHVELFGKSAEAKPAGLEGLFEIEVPEHTTYADYRVYSQKGTLVHDPYAFLPTFGEMDGYLFGRGVHYQLHEAMGARHWIQQGVNGFKFSVWAPGAEKVALVGDFNLWDGRLNPMRQLGASGVWELFVPGLESGEKYKFEIRTKEGHLRIKSDPCALFSEHRPATASVTFDVDRYNWGDQQWMQERALRSKDSFPMTIYEVHLGSWKKQGDRFLNYRQIAKELAAYCKEMGFSHVELLPISEHPLDESWGYQVTGFFAATSRYGTPEDFQFFVDHLHKEGIGVILDWVPAHFPTDDFSLAQFDGTYLYEHADPRQGFHPHWNTYIFNYGRFEVVNFLIASALFWLQKMHIDGLRVDAVASMLYLDYGRKEGEWIPNKFGGNENLEAIEFIKHLNSVVHERFPHVHMIAEESTSFTGVTHPLEWGGLGFNMKWNMGWMNDTLRYFHKDPLFRSHHQNDLTFGILYAFSERFILPLSHDEVVHGKASLISKMPGDDWQKFANLRLLYSYQICQPGKKLLFMGAEMGQWTEWNCKQEISWELLRHERHVQLHRFFKEINHFYHENPSLWEFDFDHRGFEWVDFSDRQNAVISYLRKSANRFLFVVHNFTPNFVPDYMIALPNVASIREVFNTDREEYWGSGKINATVEIIRGEGGKRIGVKILLSPLSTMCFEVQFVS
ncbi:MAG: 1,4-alpha-glucan branching protein GlgB [Verrucomicrobia bacterium]|nr:1,4-alpha-glucan branching protein GlgB [Verrucomicrobiota bacterium]